MLADHVACETCQGENAASKVKKYSQLDDVCRAE